MKYIVTFLAVVVLVGCAHPQFTRGRGDVGTFIIERSVLYGGTPISTNALPIIGDTWRYSEDAHGIIIRMPRDRYSVVERFLQQAFGSPQFGPLETTDGAKLGGYRLTPRGGGIQYTYDDEGTQVIVLRPLKWKHAQ